MNMLGSFDNRQSQAVQHFQSTQQSPEQIRFAQSDVQGPGADAATSGFDTYSFRTFEGIQPVPKATSDSLDTMGAQVDQMEPVNGFSASRGTETPGDGRARIPFTPEEVHWNDESTSSTGRAEHLKMNLPSLSAEPLSIEDESHRNNILDLTYIEELPETGEDGSVAVDTRVVARDPNHAIPTHTANATDESEDMLMLQPVIDYLRGNDYSEGTPGQVASNSIPECDGDDGGLGSTYGVASTSDKNDSVSSRPGYQSTADE